MPFTPPVRTVADIDATAAGYTWNGSVWVPPTPAPPPPGLVATFDASSGQGLTSNGIVNFLANGRAKNNEIIPNGGGLRGWRFRYQPSAADEDPANSEARYEILTPSDEFYEVFSIWQPENYALRSVYSATTTTPFADFSDWVKGDTVTTSGGQYATFHSVKDLGGSTKLFFIDNQHPFVEWMWDTGDTITNDRNAEAFTVTGRNREQSNNKLSAMWVNDFTGDEGYENGSFTVQTVGTAEANSFAPSGRLLPTLAISETSGGNGDVANQIATPPFDPPLMFDVANNGSVVDICIRRKRETSAGANDGIYQLWLKSATIPTWTLVHENFSLKSYTSFNANQFTHGYFMGYSNSGFDEMIEFFVTQWSLYSTKPNFLP